MDGGADLAAPAARIGPNAVLQLLPVLERAGGRDLRDHMLASAGFFGVPDAEAMIDERAVARLHRTLRAEVPDLAPSLLWVAGRRTADYILANRIPSGAQALLRALPPRLAAPLLTRAIARHAWTFAGSGRFSVNSHRPLTLEIAGNPVVCGERAAAPICHWHMAVFERLFTTLVDGGLVCEEVACCAAGAPACRFVIARQSA